MRHHALSCALWRLTLAATPIVDDNVGIAVKLLISDEELAIATFGNISDWDTSSVTNMANIFNMVSSSNADISGWNTTSVTSMSHMFYGATLFNQDIGLWNTK